MSSKYYEEVWETTANPQRQRRTQDLVFVGGSDYALDWCCEE